MITLFKVRKPNYVSVGIEEAFESGVITEGPMVKEFEEALKEEFFDETTPLCTVNSGTSALTLSLRLLDLEEGTKVVTTPMTCSATNIAILNAGAVPVFADIDPNTGLIDVTDVAQLVEEHKPGAIMCVDWGGMPCDLWGLQELGVPVVEDAAHALGASIGGSALSISDFTCFSFQAIKHLTTGDGGLIVGNSRRVADIDRAKILRWFGIDRGDLRERTERDIVELGYKFHMNDLAASIGLAGLENIQEGVFAAHRSNAHFYLGNLSERFSIPTKDDRLSSYWIFTVLLPADGLQAAFKAHMKERGVDVDRVHRRNDEFTLFRPYTGSRSLPGVSFFYSRMMCLPCHYALTIDDLERIVTAANEFVEKI